MKTRVKYIVFLLFLGIPGLLVLARMDVPAAKVTVAFLAFAACALLGLWMSKHVGLSSVILNWLGGENHRGLSSAFACALIGAIALGYLWVFFAWLFHPIVPENLYDGISVWQAVLHGAVYEEIIFRWGLMSLILFLFWRHFGDLDTKPGPLLCWMSILLSSIPFALAHLLSAWKLGYPTVSPFALFLLTLNCIAGVVLGWLYWKKGLESAILAHMGAHIVIFSNWRA